MKPRKRIRRILPYVLIALGVSLIGFAGASSLLFTQNFPAVPSGVITASCATLQAWNAPVPVTGGIVVFNCTGQYGAFVVNTPTNATPTFALPTNATDLYAYPSVLGTFPSTCSGFTGAIALISESPVDLSTKGSWSYCIDATGALQGFSIAWSQ